MTQTMTAMYASRTAAEAARADLITLGLTTDAVMVRGADDTTGVTATEGKEGGFWSGLADFFMPDDAQQTYAEGVRGGGFLLTANVPDQLLDQAEDVLERSEPLELDEQTQSWQQSSPTDQRTMAGLATAAPAAMTAGATVTETTTTTTNKRDVGTAGAVEMGADDKIQLVEEQLQVGKRQVSGGGVRVRTYVKETPVEEQVNLRSERVTIERRPVDREVSAKDVDFTEMTIEATERSEEAVMAKTVRVKEEIGLHKDVDTRTETVSDTVRSTDVEIEDTRTGQVIDTGKVVDQGKR